jgi:hypothetical protein
MGTHFVYGEFMMVQPREASELCSKSEWELVESSFYPIVETLPRSGLKSRLDRARKLYRKTIDLVSLQHSDSRKRTTRRKTEIFAEAVDRFEATLNPLENAPSIERSTKDDHNKGIDEEIRSLNIEALREALLERTDREFQSRKNQALSVLGVRGEQQGQKSGARNIQSHVGSVNRRQQGRRDTKNR